MSHISDVICEMRNGDHISKNNAVYLTINQKQDDFTSYPRFTKLVTRDVPIVSANGHPTEKISEFVDLHFQPHVHNLPSYLKDTTYFLKKQDAMGPLLPKTLLASIDVTSLYKNIPHQDCIKACKDVWGKRSC